VGECNAWRKTRKGPFVRGGKKTVIYGGNSAKEDKGSGWKKNTGVTKRLRGTFIEMGK